MLEAFLIALALLVGYVVGIFAVAHRATKLEDDVEYWRFEALHAGQRLREIEGKHRSTVRPAPRVWDFDDE